MTFGCANTNHQLHVLSRARAEELSESSPLVRKHIVQLRTAINQGEALKIPSPSIFDFSPKSESQPTQSAKSSLPSTAELATHLELLETLYVLRQRVLVSTEIDQAFDINPIRKTVTGRDGKTKTLKDDTFWDRRQMKWTRFVEFAVVRFLAWQKNIHLDAEGKTHVLNELPPVDVLMVWHALLLNPKLFHENFGKTPLYWIRIPWALVHNAIDSLRWDYVQSFDQAAHFTKITGLDANLFEQFKWWSHHSELTGVEELKLLSTYSLSRDEKDNITGTQSPTPNATALRNTTAPGASPGVLSHTQQVVANEQINAARQYATLFHKHKIAPGNLASELRDAVVRQCEFVDKMNKHLWIRSPALLGTLRRAVDRYDRFLTLIKLHPKLLAVPTLDIDLAWHTHQCTAGFYSNDVRARTGKFVNHDDKLGSGTLDDGYSQTKKLYRFHFIEDYNICGCWECESLLEHLEQARSRGISTHDMDQIAKDVEQDVSFYREMEVATRTRDHQM